jgi:hypothetical protein
LSIFLWISFYSVNAFPCLPSSVRLERQCPSRFSHSFDFTSLFQVVSQNDDDDDRIINVDRDCYVGSSLSKSSPWASVMWILRLNFGRPSYGGNSQADQKTNFPFLFGDQTSFGESGSRLVVTCPVLVTAADVVGEDRNEKMVGRGSSVIRPVYASQQHSQDSVIDEFSKHYSYVTLQGKQNMKLSPGGWVLKFPPKSSANNKGVATKLRFWLDLKTDIERNDIKLSAGTRLYFAANCWRDDDFDVGVAKLRPIQRDAEDTRRLVKERLSHESGDRRLDGIDALETIKAYGDMAKLVLEQEQKIAKLQEALLLYPSADDGDVELLPAGPWPGSDEWLTLSDERYNPIFVVKDLGPLRGQEYEMVGTWTGKAVTEDEA